MSSSGLAKGRDQWVLVANANANANATRRGVDEPAPTITGAHDHGERRWLRTGNFTAVARDDDGKRTAGGSVPYERESSEPAPTVGCGGPGEWVHGERPWLRAGTNAHDTARPADEPVPTLRFGPRLNDVSWVGERPSTTVAGDPRVHPPGHKVNGEDVAAGRDGYEGRAGLNAVRVSLAEALVLQSFPPDYPVQGTKTAQFRQVGNAVPPLFAWHVLRAVIPAAESEAS